MRLNRGARSKSAAIVTTGIVWAAVAAAGVVIGGTPAVAAGGTSATALTLALDGDLDVGPISAALVSANSRVGYVTAPGNGTTKGSVGTLNASGTAVDGQAGVGSLTATRTDIGARSSAQLVGADVDALGENLVTTGDVEASAQCPVGGSPAVQANVADLRVLGQRVNASVSPVTVSADASLGVTGVADAKIVATVNSPRSVGSSSAAVTAVRVSAKVVASTLLGADVTVNLGHVDIASAQCATPDAVKPSASSINPDNGPTSGGQTVTITGDAFVPGDTSVHFGDSTVPASQVDVNDGGTSLTVKTPAHVAGPVEVTVTTPGGTDGPLDYTYIGQGSTAPNGGTRDPGDDTVTGTEGGTTGSGGGGRNGSGSGSIVPASQTTTGTADTSNAVDGLLASTGPLGLVGIALLGLVLIVGGAMLAKRASERPGLAENPWVDSND